ncbi:hypothetical protein [Embleya sp. NPDC059237]|uniref:hypothetical protein n=1 Tax=Embleya sp. NPDC059237 TaxID=3346784 RepID=UPI00368797D5
MTEATVRWFRRLPVEVQAVQVVGDETGDLGRAIARWCHGSVGGDWTDPVITVGTPFGPATARCGDWILREPMAVGWTYRVVWNPTMGADHEEIGPDMREPQA